jgi:hypothetical protein
MDGYSVTEAASVLGVPTERVWELLARGVLSGAPDGETGMRVFLQPRPAPAPARPADDAPRANGSDRGELSPFRELLTEFRNLTERYGQALLALGEARGEVASLRSRVDVLEARMELRLPLGGQPNAPQWPMPPAPEVAAPAAPAPPDGDDDAQEAHRSRRRGPRRATESFAEALARAEDPSVPELRRTADRAAQAGVSTATEATAAESFIPREVPPAEAVPVADERAADDAAGWAVRSDARDADEEDVAASEERVATSTEMEPAPAPVGVSEGTMTDRAESPAELDASVATWPDDRAEAGPAEPASDVADTTDSDAHAPADEPETPSDPAVPIDFDEGRYTTSIEAPDWLEADVETDGGASATSDVGSPPPLTTEAPGTSPTGSEDGGRAEMEVAAGGKPVPTPERHAEAGDSALGTHDDDLLPGGRELDEALAALDDLRSSAGTTEDEVWPPIVPPLVPPHARPFVPRPQGPATRAYRRLRRIFPE